MNITRFISILLIILLFIIPSVFSALGAQVAVNDELKVCRPYYPCTI